MIKAILAVGENGEIGQNGDMPWRRGLPKDLEYFREQTINNEVIMGNLTFKSLGLKNGLPNRYNTVLSSVVPELDKVGFREHFNVSYVNKAYLESTLKLFAKLLNHHTYWLIGGSSIYKQFWEHVEEVHLTRVKSSFPEADTFFEPDLTGFEKVGVDRDVSGEYDAFVEVWKRIK